MTEEQEQALKKAKGILHAHFGKRVVILTSNPGETTVDVLADDAMESLGMLATAHERILIVTAGGSPTKPLN